MEYHKYFMNIAYSGSAILDIFYSSSNKNDDLTFSDFVSKCVKNCNSPLELIENLKFLRLLLCYQYKLNYELEITYKLTELSQLMKILSNDHSKENVSIISDIVILLLVLEEDKQNFMQILENFKASNIFSESQELSTIHLNWGLKVFKYFLISYEIFLFWEKENKLKNINLKYLDSIYKVYSSSILNDTNIWSYKEQFDIHNLYYVLEKIIKKEKTTKILEPYYLKILDHDFALPVLCIISDLIFPLNFHDVKIDLTMIQNKKLWNLIWNKITSDISQERKEALYIFEKLCDFIDTYEKDMNLCQKKMTPLICTQNDFQKFPLHKVKTNFILIIEALEEKQQHLIIPILPHVTTLIDVWKLYYNVCENCFVFDWIHCIFVRLLQHDSSVIVKWGLMKSLELDLEAYKKNSFLFLIVKSLNNTFLYELIDDSKEPHVVTALINLFNKAENKEFHLVENLINLLNQVQWGPIAIFYIFQSIVNLPNESKNFTISQKNLNIIRSLIETNLKWHPVMLSSMTQITLIEIYLRFSDIQNLMQLLNFLSNFSLKIIIEKSCWSILAVRMKEVSYEKALDFISQICKDLLINDENISIQIPVISLLFQLLYEGGVIFQTEKSLEIQELTSLFVCLEKVDLRPYVKISSIIKIIELLHSFISLEYKFPIFINLFFNNFKETIWKFLVKLLNNENLEYVCIETCSKILLDISLGRLEKSTKHEEEYEKKLESKCIEFFTTSHNYSQVQLLYALKLWSNISHFHNYNNAFFYEIVGNLLKMYKVEEKHEKKGIISSKYYEYLSLLIKNHVTKLELNDLKEKNWLDMVSVILDAAGNEALVYFGNILNHYAFVFKNNDDNLKEIELLIKSFWNCNFGSKRDKLFWSVAQNLTTCINSRNFLNCKFFRPVIKEFNEKMLLEADKLPGLKFILCKYSEIDAFFDQFTEVILDSLLQGQVMRRDQRIDLQARIKGMQMLSPFKLKNGEILDAYSFLNRHCNIDAMIRATAIVQLCKALLVDRQNASKFLPLVLEKLLAVKNKRYYANSYIHKLKHRIMQVLLLLLPYLDKDSNQILYYALKDSVFHDSDQFSVVLLKKWIFINFYLKNESMISDLWCFFDQICLERPNSANFIIGIIWHVAKFHIEDKKYKFSNEALSKLVYCCMGQQFNMRLYGQLFFVKLYELISHVPEIQIEYESLYKIISNNLNSNLKKNSIKIDDEFFYTIFNPIKHYTLETIYYQLPRLSNVGVEEWITKENFEVHSNNSSLGLDIFNDDNLKYKNSMPDQISKQNEIINEEIDLNELSFDKQKKIMPKKFIIPEDESEHIHCKEDLNNKKRNIIVVASLVEKSQNLGGIARTCEVFGSQELVISSLKQIEDKEFQVLSVSADRWLKISEIKPLSLGEYLSEMKENGWSVIGAEQTMNSKNLVDYKFPKQTVLVLGNEKSGIPANILPLLDACVEIPQSGVVRSLNVHVSTAICIWEYIKQHQLSTK